MMVSPGNGFGSKSPQAVWITVLLRALAKAGRSLNCVSPFKSRPSVILNGRPELIMMNGARRNPHGAETLPPITERNRESKPARPYSDVKLYWLAGNVPAPSVLLLAL